MTLVDRLDYSFGALSVLREAGLESRYVRQGRYGDHLSGVRLVAGLGQWLSAGSPLEPGPDGFPPPPHRALTSDLLVDIRAPLDPLPFTQDQQLLVATFSSGDSCSREITPTQVWPVMAPVP